MKKQITFLIFVILMLSLLTVCAFAANYSVQASTEAQIADSIKNANDGDTVNISLTADIVITSTVKISKSIALNLSFNSYQINYTGSTSNDVNKPAFYIDNDKAIFNIYGSNKLNSEGQYTHYSDAVRPDMKGTGCLITVTNGTVNIKDAYLFGASNAFIINSPYVGSSLTTGNLCYINVNNSVLRMPENSTFGAITLTGKNGGEYVRARVVKMENSVFYGGFKGESYCFNATVGTSFTNVKLYDFKIVNDCWYNTSNVEILEIMMNSYENAAAFTNCTFEKYDGTKDNVVVQTATGKQNIKLINCSYNQIGVNASSFGGDKGGAAAIYVLSKSPICTETGIAYAWERHWGALEENKEVTLDKTPHTVGEVTELYYENGYSKNGTGYGKCTQCGAMDENPKIIPPIFTSLGYSLNEQGTSVALGTKVNHPQLEAFEKFSKKTIDFGVFAGDESVEASIVDGKITTTGGMLTSCRSVKHTNYDVRLTDELGSNKKVKFVLEFYVCDGEKIEFPDNGKIDILSLEEIEEMTNETTQKALKLLETKHKLYYNDDGSFKTLIIADAHMNTNANATDVQEVKDRIKLLVDRENPDLVIFTGDNTISSNSEEQLRKNIDALVGYIEEKQIPWCHVYGNHDHEGAISRERQQVVYESYEYCVSKRGPEDIYGVGNYVLGVYNKDGSLGSVIYCIDSGAYASGGGYDYIKEDQIAWYKDTSETLQAYNDGNLVKGIMAFHIPMYENRVASDNRNNKDLVSEYTGDTHEGICSSNSDVTNMFETMLERGDIKAVVTGHDHKNDYMFNYRGIKLSSSPNVSDLTYYSTDLQGARVFDLNLTTIDDVKTYVTYVIERISSDDFDSADTNTSLIDFDNVKPSEVVCEGYDGGTLGGSLTAQVTDNKGANGSDALEVIRSAGANNNSEVNILLDRELWAKVGENQYLIVWMDLTNVDFRKACFGILPNGTTAGPYRTDDNDTVTQFYYLADGATEWTTMSHGSDGCFGTAQSSPMKGLKGYFAFKLTDMKNGGTYLNADTLVTGVYMYLDLASGDYSGKPFYIDDISIVADYNDINN